MLYPFSQKISPYHHLWKEEFHRHTVMICLEGYHGSTNSFISFMCLVPIGPCCNHCSVPSLIWIFKNRQCMNYWCITYKVSKELNSLWSFSWLVPKPEFRLTPGEAQAMVMPVWILDSYPFIVRSTIRHAYWPNAVEDNKMSIWVGARFSWTGCFAFQSRVVGWWGTGLVMVGKFYIKQNLGEGKCLGHRKNIHASNSWPLL